MPFDTSESINTQPNVRVFIEGLLLLRPGQEGVNTCEIHAVDHASDHTLSVEVFVDRPQPNYSFLNLDARDIRSRGLTIGIQTPRGVKKYAPQSGPAQGVYPFDEAIDFHVLHDSSVTPARPGSGIHQGLIKLKDGVLYTAAHKPSEVSLWRGGTCTDRHPVATILGASIELQGQEKLVMNWGSDPDENIELPLDEDLEDDPNSKYIIWIRNSRRRPRPDTGNDFPHLYHGLAGVASGQQYTLEFRACTSPAGDPIVTTPKIPCMPGVVGG